MITEPAAINALIDRCGLYGFGEKLRAMKAYLASIAGNMPSNDEFPDDPATVIPSNRQDAATLKPVTLKSMREITYHMDIVNAALQNIPDDTIEAFCVRAKEFDRL